MKRFNLTRGRLSKKGGTMAKKKGIVKKGGMTTLRNGAGDRVGLRMTLESPYISYSKVH